MGSSMDIKGVTDYCFFCRRDSGKEKGVFDRKLGKYICVWCADQVKNTAINHKLIEQRFTTELGKFLANLCLERSRSCSQNGRYLKHLLCTGEEGITTRTKITKLLMNYDNYTTIAKIKNKHQNDFLFYCSDRDIFVLQKQPGDKKRYYTYFLIGRIEITELFTILR